MNSTKGVTPADTYGQRSDAELQAIVQEELRWDPRLTDAAAIGVAVDQHVLTLSGRVISYAQKVAAQEAAHRVAGVWDVANEITVEYPGHPRTDSEIAQAVRHALEWDALVPDRYIRSTVTDGWVTLEGNLAHRSQVDDAVRAIRNLEGIHGIVNALCVEPLRPGPKASDIRASIEAALERQAEREANRLGITVHEGTVTLTGTVRSWQEKRAAEGVAAFAPGVRHLENFLVVIP